MRLRTLLALLSLSLIGGTGCRTRLWDLIGPDAGVDADWRFDQGSPFDQAIPPDFLPPPDLVIPFVCREIYVVDSSGMFSSFDPLTARFDDVRKLDCPTNSSPQTMSVARDGRAWVFYSNHMLFYVDLKTGACSPSGFDPTQIDNNTHFGSSFSADQPGGVEESAFLALPGDEVFGRIAPATLKVTKFGAPGVVRSTGAEMTGTSSAELWGFFPARGSSYVARIDKTTGAQSDRYDLPEINTDNAGYAFAFWGGDFWIFIYDAGAGTDTAVYRLGRQTRETRLILPRTNGRHIVGAGVSSCAPLGLDR